MQRKITITLMLLATVILIVWDVAVDLNGIPGDTISEIMLQTAGYFPLLPIAWGVITGHFFSLLPRPLVNRTGSIIILGLHLLVFVVWHLCHVYWFKTTVYTFLQQNVGVPALYGYVLGMLAWLYILYELFF